MNDRQAKVDTVVQSLERDLELLCVTGVEDQLQVRTLRWWSLKHAFDIGGCKANIGTTQKCWNKSMLSWC